MKKNYKSDFDALLRLRTCAGDGDALRELGWPDYDWTARFYTTNKANAYVAGCRGGVCRNCFNDGGRIHVVFNDHGLGLGRLNVEFSAELPDAIYPDGSRLEVTPQSMDVELVQGRGDCGTVAELEVLLPYIKGDAFTYADFTAEQIAELQRPALEAAGAAQKVIEDADGAVVLLESALAESALATNAATVAAERAETAAETVDASVRDAAVATAKANDAAQKAESAVEGISAELDKKADKEAMREALAGKQDVLMTSADLAISGENVLSLTDNAKMRLFIDMFNKAAGDAGYARITDGVFDCMLNGLRLTYEEALEIYVVSIDTATHGYPDIRYRYCGSRCRTLLPLRYVYGDDWYLTFYGCPNLEVIRLTPDSIMKTSYRAFAASPKLRKVIGGLNAFALQNPFQTFVGCTSLEYIELRQLCYNIAFPDSPLLTRECLRYFIVHRRASGGPFTITVHPDVYAKLTGDTTNTAAGALTAEELADWHAVLTEALSKNISFATI